MTGIKMKHILGKISLKAVFIIPFLIQIIMAVGIISHLCIRNGQLSVNELAVQLQEEIAARVEQNLSDFLVKPHILNQLNAASFQAGLVNAGDTDGLRHHFLQQLQAFGNITGCAYATGKGTFIGAGIKPDGESFDSAISGISPGDRNYYLYSIDKQGKALELVKTFPNYDLRARPWYKAAVAAGKATWSPVYVYYSHRFIGISALLPIYDHTGMPDRIHMAAMTLNHINEFASSLSVGKNGRVFIMERSGLLIASSVSEPLYSISEPDKKKIRKKAVESQSPMIGFAARHLETLFGEFGNISGTHQLAYEMDGERHFLRASVYADNRGIEWIVGVVVPEADFMDRIAANKRMIYFLTVIILIIALAIGILTGRWVAEPILALNRAAKAIAAGQWDYYPPSAQRKDELGELARSFHRMADQLRQFVTGLEQKVADRTRKLASSNEELRLAKKSAEIAYETLQEREARYRNFVSSSLVSNFFWEFKKPMPLSLSFGETCKWFREYMVLAECNDLLAKSYGYEKAEDIIGWTFYDIILQNDQVHDEIVWNYMELNYTLNKSETQETDKQGNTIWFLTILPSQS